MSITIKIRINVSQRLLDWHAKKILDHWCGMPRNYKIIGVVCQETIKPLKWHAKKLLDHWGGMPRNY